MAFRRLVVQCRRRRNGCFHDSCRPRFSLPRLCRAHASVSGNRRPFHAGAATAAEIGHTSFHTRRIVATARTSSSKRYQGEILFALRSVDDARVDKRRQPIDVLLSSVVAGAATAAKVAQAPTKLAPKDAVNDEVDGRVCRDEDVAQMIVIIVRYAARVLDPDHVDQLVDERRRLTNQEDHHDYYHYLHTTAALKHCM